MIITLMLWPPRRRSNCTGSRTAPKPYLSDEQWLLIADLFPHPPVAPQGGRPRVLPRPCLEGILWVLTSGARWQALFASKKGPERYPSPATCWRRHREWTDAGVFLAAWGRLNPGSLEIAQLAWPHRNQALAANRIPIALTVAMTLGLTLWMFTKNFKDGFIFWTTVFLVGIGRFFVDFLREDVLYYGLSTGQHLSLLMVIVSVYIYWKYYKKDIGRLFKNEA